MRKFIFSLVMIFTVGCMTLPKPPESVLKVANDEFRGVKTATLKMTLMSEETTPMMKKNFPMFYVDCVFYKEISEDGKKQVKVNLDISVDVTQKPLTDEAIFLMGNKKITYRLHNSGIDQMTNVEITKNGYGTDAQVTDVNTMNYQVMKTMIGLGKEFEENVSLASPVKMRFYAGTEPMTFVIRTKNLQKLVDFCKI